MEDGSERVLDAQEELKYKARLEELKKLRADLEKKANDIKDRVAKLSKVAENLVAKHNGNTETLKSDVGISLVKGEVEKLELERTAAEQRSAEFEKELTEIEKGIKVSGDFRITNLVGVFGPKKLATEPWYKKLFG